MTVFCFSVCFFNKNKWKKLCPTYSFSILPLLVYFLYKNCPLTCSSHSCTQFSRITKWGNNNNNDDNQNNGRCISQLKPQKQIQLISRLKRLKYCAPITLALRRAIWYECKLVVSQIVALMHQINAVHHHYSTRLHRRAFTTYFLHFKIKLILNSLFRCRWSKTLLSSSQNFNSFYSFTFQISITKTCHFHAFHY